MYALLNNSSLVQSDWACDLIILAYSYRHAEIHSCIRLKLEGPFYFL